MSMPKNSKKSKDPKGRHPGSERPPKASDQAINSGQRPSTVVERLAIAVLPALIAAVGPVVQASLISAPAPAVQTVTSVQHPPACGK